MLNRWIGLLLTALLVVTGATACGSDDESSASEESASETPAALEDVPDVVAEVNGEELGKDEFVQAYEAQSKALEAQAAQAAQAGQEPPAPDEAELRDQVVQSMITEELLVQEADRREIEATDEQVQTTLDELATQNGLPSADALVKALEDQGLDQDEIQDRATQQARFDLLIADDNGPVTVSDQEVKALYEQVKAQQAAGAAGGAGGAAQQVPPLKQVRPQLETQVQQQKETEAARGLIEKLREDADITVNL